LAAAAFAPLISLGEEERTPLSWKAMTKDVAHEQSDGARPHRRSLDRMECPAPRS